MGFACSLRACVEPNTWPLGWLETWHCDKWLLFFWHSWKINTSVKYYFHPSTQRPLAATKQMAQFTSAWSPLALTVGGNSCEQQNSNKVKLQTIKRQKWTQEESSSATIVRVAVNGWNLHWKRDSSGVDNARLDGETIPFRASLQRFFSLIASMSLA